MTHGPTGSDPEISIVCPCYNGAHYLDNSLTLLTEFLSDSTELADTCEVILVDDGSTDDTEALVRRRFPHLVYLRHDRNRGKGAAVRTGMQQARGAYRIFLDADMPFELDILDAILRYLRDKEFDVVIGRRRENDAVAHTSPGVLRRLSSRLFTLLVSRFVVTGVRDTQCGVKGFRAAASDTLFNAMTVEGFAFDVELLYLSYKHDYDVKRLPVRLRKTDTSTVSLWRHGPAMLWEVFKLPLKFHTGRYGRIHEFREDV